MMINDDDPSSRPPRTQKNRGPVACVSVVLSFVLSFLLLAADRRKRATNHNKTKQHPTEPFHRFAGRFRGSSVPVSRLLASSPHPHPSIGLFDVTSLPFVPFSRLSLSLSHSRCGGSVFSFIDRVLLVGWLVVRAREIHTQGGSVGGFTRSPGRGRARGRRGSRRTGRGRATG